MVKSSNERNPCCQLPAREGGDSGETAQINWEEGGDDVRSVWPLCPGLHTYYNAQYRGGRSREAEEILKTGPSSDCRLQPAYTKPESLVMAHQLRRREYVPGSCTHRPSHHGSRSHPKYLKPTARRQGPKVIQPQVPLRLPCYDFIPVTSLTLGPCLLAVGFRYFECDRLP